MNENYQYVAHRNRSKVAREEEKEKSREKQPADSKLGRIHKSRDSSMSENLRDATQKAGLNIQFPQFFPGDLISKAANKGVVTKDLATQFRASNAQKVEWFTPDEGHLAPELIRLNDKLVSDRVFSNDVEQIVDVPHAQLVGPLQRTFVEMHANSTCQLLTIGGDDDDKRRPSTVSDTDALGDSPGNKIPESVLQNANRRRMVKHEEAVPHIFLYTDSPIDIDENGLFTFSPGPRTNLNGETAGCTGLLIPLGYLETGYTMLNLVSSNFVCQPEQLKEACCTWGPDIIKWNTPVKNMSNKMVAVHTTCTFVVVHHLNGSTEYIMAETSLSTADVIQASLERNGCDTGTNTGTYWWDRWTLMQLNVSHPLPYDCWLRTIHRFACQELWCVPAEAAANALLNTAVTQKGHGLKSVFGRAGLHRLKGTRNRDFSESDAETSFPGVSVDDKPMGPRGSVVSEQTAANALRRVQHKQAIISENKEIREMDEIIDVMTAEFESSIFSLYEDLEGIGLTLPIVEEEQQVIREQSVSAIMDLEYMVAKWDEFDDVSVDVNEENEKASKALRTIEEMLGDVKDVLEMQDDRLEVATQRMMVFIKQRPPSWVVRYCWGMLSLFIALVLSTVVFVVRVWRPVRTMNQRVLQHLNIIAPAQPREVLDSGFEEDLDNEMFVSTAFLESMEAQSNSQWERFTTTITDLYTTKDKDTAGDPDLPPGTASVYGANKISIGVNRNLERGKGHKSEMDLYKAKNGLKATSYNKSKSSNGLGIVQPMQRVAENIDTDDIPLRRNRSVRREKRARRRRQMIMADSSEESDR